MDDLIYFSSPTVSTYDQSLRERSYKYHEWFNLDHADVWPMHYTSRVTKLDTPWPLANSMAPLPDHVQSSEKRFDVVIESIAAEFAQLVKKTGRKPYVCWSGGIDSTAILVSVLKTCDQSFLENLTILLGKDIHQENSYFYHHFVKDRLDCQDIDGFRIDSSNYHKIIVVDGEAGNQIMGHAASYKLLYFNQEDLLDRDWKTIKNLTEIYTGSTDFHHELIQQSIKHAPLPITTVYDYFWWLGFNFKFDDVLLRKMLSYAAYLTPEQSKDFWKHGLYRFYAHDLMQQWSMATLDLRRQTCKRTPKYEQKKYIVEFDQNPFWFANKHQEMSMSDVFFKMKLTHPVFALDRAWKKYSFANQEDRRFLGQILEKA